VHPRSASNSWLRPHRGPIATNYEGDTTVGNLLVSFIMSSCGEKCQMTSMITRSKNEVHTMVQDGLTTVLRWSRFGIRYQHELLFRNTIGNVFDMPEIFRPLRMLLTMPYKLSHTMAKNALTNGAILWRSEPNLILFLFVCPSCVNIGTVWRLHKALYESELWPSMTPAVLRKLEHSHRFCLKFMQGLPWRTPTNFTLPAINAVPTETVIDHKKTELS